jgi:SAM-dependent methyltransferase
MVFISIGALCWLPDLEKLFTIAVRLLKPAGKLVIYELHPISNVIAAPPEKEYDPNDPLKICYRYFQPEPLVSNDGIDYVGKTTYQGKTKYDFMHTMGYIITSIVKNGIVLEEFSEYQHDISDLFDHLGDDSKLPLSYIIIANKI